ncbi:MAG: hypothetical protein Ct9H300mP15_24520 [Gemmatimonadota bacterium]|nr:MAG: hypothetical protein Ct9H300mP15_24520 [Gemmatimonadota bacterium]
MAQERVTFQGLPARICWLGQGARARFGVAMNELVGTGEISAPIVIGRDHLDTGSVASPNRETEAMKDGTDAVADWPILNAFSNSFRSELGVVSPRWRSGDWELASCRPGTRPRGTAEMTERISRVLTNDPGIGVARHADAGYELAREIAKREGIQIPMDAS